MKCFEIVLFATNKMCSCPENPDLWHELGVILANSLEEAEGILGMKHDCPAPRFLAEKVPPTLSCEHGEFQRYGEGKVLIREVPYIRMRRDLEAIVASTNWTRQYYYGEDK